MGLIYCIRNLANGKCYVGQTSTTLERRYNGKWHERTTNRHLKFAVKKYGVDNFSVEILENQVDATKHLNELESFWADKMNCYHPNGYNLLKCGNGKKWHPETLAMVSKPVLCSNGVVYPSAHEAARQLGVRQSCIVNALNGKDRHAGGYAFTRDIDGEVPKVRRLRNSIVPGRHKVLANGLEFDTLTAAARALKISISMASQLANGYRKSDKFTVKWVD